MFYLTKHVLLQDFPEARFHNNTVVTTKVLEALRILETLMELA